MKLQARRRWVEMALILFVLWFAIGSVSVGAQASAGDIQKVEGLLRDIRRTAELVERLLQINYDLDYAKVGIDEDGDVFVRIDTRLRIMDVEEMNEVIAQVDNTTDTTYVALKPYLIR